MTRRNRSPKRRRDAPEHPLEVLTSPQWLTEARRKAIHLSFIVLPIELLLRVLPWPRSHREFRVLFVALTAGAVAVDVVRIHDRRVRTFFRQFFGEMIREHERMSLLGSTYLLLAALIALEVFPQPQQQPLAAAALGFTVLGDAMGALVGKAYGRHRVFNKSFEGALGCLLACLAWAAVVARVAHVPWPILLAGAFAATIIEVLPIPLDDNLGITLAASYTMKLMHG